MKTSIADALAEHPGRTHRPVSRRCAVVVTVLANGSMTLKVFRPSANPDGRDRQQPHARTSCTWCTAAAPTSSSAASVWPACVGDAFFVGAGAEHRFENFTMDFVTWVVFYGPQGGET
jgi:hypothetical protein